MDKTILASSSIQTTFRSTAIPVVTPSGNRGLILEKSSAQVAAWVSPPQPCALKRKKRKRKNPLTVRLSDVEREIVRAKAKTVGCSINSYVRAATLGSNYRPPIDKALTGALLAVNRELTAQGNNLNQIAKQLNAEAITKTQGESMLDILGRSMLRTHKAIRQALPPGKLPEL
jgi:hypothetical protein